MSTGNAGNVMFGVILAALAGCSGNNDAATAKSLPPLAMDCAHEREANQSAVEPNDTTEQANCLYATESLWGELSPGADEVDLFKFQLNEDRRYRFSVVSETADTTLGLAVIDTTDSRRFEATNGAVEVALVKDRDYVLEVRADSTGPVAQGYEAQVFRAASSGDRPVEECGGSSGVLCR